MTYEVTFSSGIKLWVDTSSAHMAVSLAAGRRTAAVLAGDRPVSAVQIPNR